LTCLPSEIDNELNKDIQSLKIILAAREEMKNDPEGGSK